MSIIYLLYHCAIGEGVSLLQPLGINPTSKSERDMVPERYQATTARMEVERTKRLRNGHWARLVAVMARIFGAGL